MNRSMMFAASCLLLVGDSFQLNAQRRPGTGRVGRTRVGAPAVRGRWFRAGAGYGLGTGPYDYYGGGAVNAAGDAARGFSEVIRAQGEAEESASRARINNEEARAKYIENKTKFVQHRHERKKTGQAARAEYYAKKRASVQGYIANKEVWSPKPNRLTSSQFDAATGRINWPDALLAKEYSESRQELDKLFELRSLTSTTREVAVQIRSLTQNMQAELKNHIRELPANDYIAARKFLEAVSSEV